MPPLPTSSMTREDSLTRPNRDVLYDYLHALWLEYDVKEEDLSHQLHGVLSICMEHFPTLADRSSHAKGAILALLSLHERQVLDPILGDDDADLFADALSAALVD